ncbi:TonB-dependent receptor [Flavobacterium sp.]|uniref:TonB-dependent receptor n=1 Tax=Flavobacterium sp. TaxID=239 RepID=UPI00261FE56D|nr:TonB-dependent receptor [Flavobacterium sp.]
MKINFQYKIAIVTVLLGTQINFAQKKDENIGTEVVNVVKPYTPTISDAFKVKETPSLEDDDNTKKENIQYNIFSFPVASTFTPSKGKAAGVDKGKQEKLYSNYATLAAGNYGNINAELFVTQTLESGDYVGAMLRHLSSQGGIKDLDLDDKFSNSSIDLTYGSKSRNLSWNADLGYQHQMYNWYGLNPLFYENFIPADKDAFINGIDSKQTYQTISLGGRLALGESVLKEATIKFNRFSDAFSSGENRLVAKPSLAFDVMDEKIKVDFVFDYINGKFDKDYNGITELKYGYTNVGMKPSFQINKDDLSVNLGVGFFYSMATESGKNKFFIYPNITASYKVVGDLMVAYAGAEGALKQNSYQEFVQENFFVSPTLGIGPTDQKFDIYVGLKGKLANTIGYNIRGSLMNEGGKPMFLRNEFSHYNTNKNGYAYGNSFNVVYDDVKIVSFYGELKADFSKNVSFGVNGTFSSYTTDIQEEAWNLPALKLGANLDFNITDKWYAGTSVFFVGERKDLKFVQTALAIFPPTYTTETTTLDSYFDLNAHIGFKYNERLTFFLKGNNLANQSYQRWINYPVQGVQGLLGANYKFDF